MDTLPLTWRLLVVVTDGLVGLHASQTGLLTESAPLFRRELIPNEANEHQDWRDSEEIEKNSPR
jgi:hypothetical protein